MQYTFVGEFDPSLQKKTNLSVGVNGGKKAARGLVFVFKNTKSLTLDFFLSEVTGLRVKGGRGKH